MSQNVSNNQSVSIGFPFISILTIVLVIAKLTGHFAFSWWVVFAPILVSVGVFVAFLALFILIVAITSLKD